MKDLRLKVTFENMESLPGIKLVSYLVDVPAWYLDLVVGAEAIGAPVSLSKEENGKLWGHIINEMGAEFEIVDAAKLLPRKSKVKK